MPLPQYPPSLLVVASGILGAVLGSFYSVCVSRFLSGESIIFPPSHCPLCGRRLRPWELVPLVSYVLLRGRCAGCKRKIDALYPLLELASVTWAVLVYYQVGATLWFPAYLALGGLYLVASAIDLKIYLLPDILTYPAAVIGYCIGAFRPGTGPLAAGIGALIGFGLFWLLALVYRRLRGVDGLGGGDVKLMISVGGAVGWMGLPYAILCGSLAALLASPYYVLGKGRGRDMPIPFGPFLCLGAMVQLLYGPAILHMLAGR